jgi:hypothetical protein
MAKMQMRMSMKGFNELVQSVNDKRFTAGPMLMVMETATKEGRREAQEQSQSALVSGSMMAEATSSMGRVYSTLPQAQAAAIDRGRAPSSVRGGKMPPPDVLAAWASRNGIAQEAAVFIARAIARRGIKGRFFMRKSRAHIRKIMPLLLEDAAREITRSVERANANAKWHDFR